MFVQRVQQISSFISYTLGPASTKQEVGDCSKSEMNPRQIVSFGCESSRLLLLLRTINLVHPENIAVISEISNGLYC